MRFLLWVAVFVNITSTIEALSLNLSYNNMNASQDFSSFASINHDSTKKLDLSNNPLEEQGFKKLLPYLDCMVNLEFLDLKNTSIHTGGILELFQRAKLFPNLKHLDLSGNACLTFFATRQIGALLLDFRKLEHLHMAGLGLDKTSFLEFVRHLSLRLKEENIAECPLPLRYVDFGDRFHSIAYINEFVDLFPIGHEMQIHFRSAWYSAQKTKEGVSITHNSQKPKASCRDCLYAFFSGNPIKSKL